MKFMNKATKSIFAAVVFSAGILIGSPITTPYLGVSEVQAAVVSSVVVRGNQRIGADTIRNYVTIKPGRNYSAIEVDESLRALFATGLFEDVTITRSGSSLVVSVVENRVVNGVAFQGNKRLKDNVLSQVAQTKSRGVFTQAQVDNDIARMLEAYEAAGRFNASITSDVVDIGNNRVNVIFNINENEKTGIGKIEIIGNKAFSDRRLKAVMSTKKSNILSFLRKDDIYDEDRLAADQERLRRFYFQNGYADFDVISAVGELDPATNKFFVTITVEEGERYEFGQIEVDSILTGIDSETLGKKVTTKEGNTYNSRQVEETLERITLEAAEQGFAFVQVEPRGERSLDGNRIDIVYAVDEGPRVYIERIDIVGNTRTRDYVIRREFDIAEGDAYSKVLIDRAERRLNDLGYFERVNVATEQGSAPDRVIVTVRVQDQPTGEFSFGVGASLEGGPSADVSVSERNFLGRGQFVRAVVGGGEDNRRYQFSFTEPYFLGRRISAGFDLNRREQKDSDNQSFDITTTSGTVRFGLPLTENLNFGVRYTAELEEVSDVQTTAPLAIRLTDPERFTSAVGYRLTYNTLDNNRAPRNGLRLVLDQEFAGLGGDAQYVRTEVKADYYKELSTELELVGYIGARAGNITGLGKDVNLLDNFRKGSDIVRGFSSRGIGPRDATGDRDALGGTHFVGATAELQFPMPALPRTFGVRGSVFADAGALWGLESGESGAIAGSDDFSLRSSVGVGLIWDSPFGLLRGDIAHVLSEEDFDDKQFFRLGGGTRF